MGKPEYRRGCCTYETFFSGFIEAARRRGVPLLIVNRLRARRHWRAGMTGSEALEMQRRQLAREL